MGADDNFAHGRQCPVLTFRAEAKPHRKCVPHGRILSMGEAKICKFHCLKFPQPCAEILLRGNMHRTKPKVRPLYRTAKIYVKAYSRRSGLGRH